MYIPEFWCGVAMTIVSEFIGFIAWGMITTRSGKKEMENETTKETE